MNDFATIFFNNKKLMEIFATAEKDCAYWTDRFNKGNCTQVYRNTPAGHFIGRLGEEAIQRMFEIRGIRSIPWFRDEYLSGKADVYLPDYHSGIRIEAKSWKVGDWDERGRTVSKFQYKRVLSKTDILMWCTVDIHCAITREKITKLNYLKIYVMGFTSMKEFDQNKETYTLDGKSWIVRECNPITDLQIYLEGESECAN